MSQPETLLGARAFRLPKGTQIAAGLLKLLFRARADAPLLKG